jgi:hypothetical protein
MDNIFIIKPIKVFIIMITILFGLSIFANTKLSNWEQASPENSFRDFVISYLSIVENYNPIKNIKITQENYSKISDKEYEESEQRNIEQKPLEKDLFIQKIFPPYKVLIVGDSFIAGSLGIEIERNLNLYKDFTVVREAKSSTGLTRPDYFDWNSNLIDLIAKNKPNIVIVMFGANDAQNIPIQDKVGCAYGTDEWDKEYGKRVYAFLKILKENNIFVVWIGNPIARDINYSQKMSHLNTIFKKETSKFLNSEFLPTWNLLADSNNQYTDFLQDKNGQAQLIRESDGIHVNYYGGKIIADNIANIFSNFFVMDKK